jgi:hypothetical protein
LTQSPRADAPIVPIALDTRNRHRYVNVINIHTLDEALKKMTTANITAKLDDIGTPAWIAVMVLGFIIWWPLGLAALAFILWSGRMGCHGRGSVHWEHKMHRMQERMDRFKSRMEGSQWWGNSPSSGNTAFDEYKAETLKRLEEEQREFREFLNRLRTSKDRAEFDQFMSERRRKRDEGGSSPEPQPGLA